MPGKLQDPGEITYATDLTRAGTDLVTVAELLGHASLDSTRIYTNPRELHLTGEKPQVTC
jgi:site-specific recombinase XerD